MKILLLHNYYIHKGGEDFCFENEKSALREAGHLVEEFSVLSVPNLQGALLAFQAPFGGRFEKELESKIASFRPDILHAHNLFPLFSPRLLHKARRCGVKTVLTLHNYRPLCLNGLFFTPKGEICERCAGGNYLSGILRGCYRNSRLQSVGLSAHLWAARGLGWYQAVDTFIAPSHFLRNKYAEYGFPASKIVVQGHFLPKMSQELPLNPQAYVLFLGRLSEEKGLRWLLQVFKNPRLALKLFVAGTGPLEQVVRAACGESIKYLGFISGQEKDKLLGGAAALVMSSECYENFPLAIPEGNARGVPALVANLGSFSEMVSPGENGERYIPENADSFWTNLGHIYNPKNSKLLREQCQNYARTRFSKAEFLRVRLRLYENLIEQKPIFHGAIP